MSSYSRQQLEDWLKTIVVHGGKVLDIGGSQLPINNRLNSIKHGTEFTILDLEQPHECKQKPDIVLDLNTDSCITFDGIKSPKSWKEVVSIYRGKFDIAFCIEVSEYWWNPVEALENINWLLKDGGTLYISFHFVYPVHNPVKQDYLRYTTNGVKKLLDETGFTIEEIKPRLLQTHIANIDGMKPAKNYQRHDWQGCMCKCIKI